MLPEGLAMLKEFGLDLIHRYGFMPNKYESSVFNAKKSEIETDDFYGFGNNYAIALHHMKEHLASVETVVDIGSCWGVFSYLFKDYHYIGLEESAYIFEKDQLMHYYPHHEYVHGAFPLANPGGDVFIASMSLGYGGTLYRHWNDPGMKEQFLSEISKYRYGYTRVPEEVETWLSEVFDREEIIVSYRKAHPRPFSNKPPESEYEKEDYMVFWTRKAG